MFKTLLSQLDNTLGALTALLIFSTVFAMFVYMIFKKSNREFYENQANIPFQEGDKK